VFPSTKGYGHFQFSDYAKLTIIGVIIACVAWPIVTRIYSAHRQVIELTCGEPADALPWRSCRYERV
jgi:hypothetical protein